MEVVDISEEGKKDIVEVTLTVDVKLDDSIMELIEGISSKYKSKYEKRENKSGE